MLSPKEGGGMDPSQMWDINFAVFLHWLIKGRKKNELYGNVWLQIIFFQLIIIIIIYFYFIYFLFFFLHCE